MSAEFSCSSPGSLAAPGPRSSQMCSTYEPGASGRAECDCWYDHRSQVTDVAVPSMMPLVGPTG